MATRLEEWLALSREQPLEPGLPVCDPHHHLWDYPDTIPESRLTASHRHVRHYLLKELLEDIADNNVTQTVFIECSSMYRKDGPPELRPVGEVEFVQGIAAQSASGQYGNTAVAVGIVGFADLTLGNAAAPVLEALIAASPNRFRGIRHMATWDASSEIDSRTKDPHLLADPKFREGFALLRRYNLSFDAWLYHPQLGDLVQLSQAFPDMPIVLNHIGGPLGTGPYAGKRDEVFRDWKESIAALAQCPNVMVKLGGLGMPRTGLGWHKQPAPPDSAALAETIAPYINWCIDRLGTGRCMFESNFPVDKESYSYTVIWNAFKRLTRDFSPSERAALFHDNAVQFYQLATK